MELVGNREIEPRMTKTIGVINASNFIKFTGGAEEHGARPCMVPIAFTADRNLRDRTLRIRIENGRNADVEFDDVEEIIKYVPEVNVKIYRSGTPLGLDKLVRKPSIVVIDSSLAEVLGVELRSSSSNEAIITETTVDERLMKKLEEAIYV
jgi:hypothetical protein